MKKLLTLLLLVAVCGVMSCGDDDDEFICITTEFPDGSSCAPFDTCSNETETYYTWKGRRFNCNGNDCDQAAADLAAAIAEDGCNS